jgi:hypothetical protein
MRKSSPWQGRANSQNRFAHKSQPAIYEHSYRSDDLTARQARKLCRVFFFHPATARVIASLAFDGGER